MQMTAGSLVQLIMMHSQVGGGCRWVVAAHGHCGRAWLHATAHAAVPAGPCLRHMRPVPCPRRLPMPMRRRSTRRCTRCWRAWAAGPPTTPRWRCASAPRTSWWVGAGWELGLGRERGECAGAACLPARLPARLPRARSSRPTAESVGLHRLAPIRPVRACAPSPQAGADLRLAHAAPHPSSDQPPIITCAPPQVEADLAAVLGAVHCTLMGPQAPVEGNTVADLAAAVQALQVCRRPAERCCGDAAAAVPVHCRLGLGRMQSQETRYSLSHNSKPCQN